MDEQSLERIKAFLQKEEVQDSIRRKIDSIHSEIQVPIGRAVELTGCSVNQLRKWEGKGRIKSQKVGKHRYYSIEDLKQLVLNKRLIEAGYSPSSIPPEINSIWDSISWSDGYQKQDEQERNLLETNRRKSENLYIDERIEHARKELFWRYYASHALRLSLRLICEDIPQHRTAGLVLPLGNNMTPASSSSNIEELSKVGEALIGWLSQSGSSHTLLTTAPSFQFTNDFKFYRLQALENGAPVGDDISTDNTLLLIDRKASLSSLSSTVVNTIRRLLTPLNENKQFTRACFGLGVRDVLDPATDLNSNSDYILDGLANIVIRLGIIDDHSKWRFCCILLPDDTTLPLQRRSLVVRAQTSNAPHKVGKTTISPNQTTISISLRAYQSGQIIYRPEICEEDSTIAFREQEKNPRSAIAIPAGGENGAPAAVIYVVSDESDAFGIDDQRVLRLLGRTVEELLLTYHTRLQSTEKLSNLIMNPTTSDTIFEKKGIFSENQFVEDIETLLSDIQKKAKRRDEIHTGNASNTNEDTFAQAETSLNDGISIISIDIDRQSDLTIRYGDLFAKNLRINVGIRLHDQLRRIFTEFVKYRFYSTCADRFCLIIEDLPLEEVRKHAERIRRILYTTDNTTDNTSYPPYSISILYSMDEETELPDPETTIEIKELSVHVGVSFYPYRKLDDLLNRYSPHAAVENVRSLISRNIDQALNQGRLMGPNVVVSWDPEIRSYKKLLASEKLN